ncbi:MAG: ParB/RepB/Spo0J family partition protein [Hyphomicrobiaceae bacterium]|nr:ParB/RepB/Spo0J family partition protein [Hyphomicrobiaceae bacterium]
MNSPLPKGRLGRGLASLIGEAAIQSPRVASEGEHRVVSLDQIHAGKLNPRKDFREDELEELTNSIRQKGLVQPIIVRLDVAGGYEIVAGERRWRAAQRAGLHQVPVIVRDLGDQEMLEFAIIENVQRADLNAIEEAGGYQELVNRYGYTQERLAEEIGKSRSHLTNTLRLLRLPESVQGLVAGGKLSAGHARALVGRDDAEALAFKIIEQGMTVRDIEALVQQVDANVGKAPVSRVREKDADTKAFEQSLAELLGLKVDIKRGSGESGVLLIKYGNYDQLDYIRERLVGGRSTGS